MMRKRLKNFAALLLIAALCSPSVLAGTLPKSSPADVGLSAERLDRITQAMRRDAGNGSIPGAVSLVARNGKIAYIEAAGMADTEKKVPMRTDAIFRIYSMSKPITSVAAMMLFEEGQFFLDDPVSKYIPELGGLKVVVEQQEKPTAGVFNLPEEDPAKKPATPTNLEDLTTEPAHRDMTIHDLFRHTSGLTYGFFGNSEVDQIYQQMGVSTTDKDLAEMVAKLSKIPLKHQPGEVWEYSLSVDVLGRLIEVISGRPFDSFLKERIFDPLGMVDTGFSVPEEKMDRFAQMYTPDAKTGKIVPAPAFYSRNFVGHPTFFSGGGGLVSTASDYFRFCQMMLNGGELDGVRVLSRTTVELMASDHTYEVPMSTGRNTGYAFGLGFAVAQEPGRIGVPVSAGEYNWGGAAGTKFWIDPKEKFIGIYMVQILPHTGLHYGDTFKVLSYQTIAD
jgi:CubicO group peptidase (beta-lactamase class C family)